MVEFPKRYFNADSGLDEVDMLGKFAPMLIIAVVTDGGSAAVEGSGEANNPKNPTALPNYRNRGKLSIDRVIDLIR